MQKESDIVDVVFSDAPKPPCTYRVELSDQAKETNITTFQMLWNILINGAKRLFGANVNVQDITEEQFDLLKQYMNSIGYEIKNNYTYAADNITPIYINIWFELYIPKTKCR
jgi:hypothetical protein